jgi:Tol biopolymer transport system component
MNNISRTIIQFLLVQAFMIPLLVVAQQSDSLPGFTGEVRTEPYRNPIVFVRTEMDPQTGKPLRGGNVWVMEEDGSGQRQLTFNDNHADHPALYSDRTHVLYSEFNGPVYDRKAGARLIKLNIYDGSRELFAAEPGCALHHVSLRARDDNMIYQHDCDGGRSQRVGWGPESYTVIMDAVNSVNIGDSLIFMNRRNRGVTPPKASLVRLYGNGRGAQAIFLTDDSAFNRRPAGSADGKWIAFQSDMNGTDDEVYVARIDDTNDLKPRNVTRSPAEEGHPWFSRDGKWIVFESTRTGSVELWKVNLDTLEQVQLTFGGKTLISREPRW